MSLPERTYRHVESSRSPTIAAMEQFRRGGESSRMSPTYSPTSSRSPSSPYFDRLKHHDPEEDQGFYQRKSVLAKMKEGARRLRNSFSKRRQEDGNLTPSWGVSLEDDGEEEEEDAEYLGAPMYESELAPEALKENARQHPRANPVISEKHVLRSPVKSEVEQYQEKPLSPIESTTTTQATTATLPGPNMTKTENLAQKLTPAYAEGSDSDAANSISSKIQGLAVSRTTSSNMSSQTSSIAPPTSSAPLSTQTSFSSSLSGRNTSSPKGASVKEYLKIKFAPGNDEKVLSEVISEAMSPRRTSARTDAGVMDKVRGAMNSLLLNEEPSSQQYAVKNPTTRASSQTPAIVSSNLQEVGQEENHRRILQAN